MSMSIYCDTRFCVSRCMSLLSFCLQHGSSWTVPCAILQLLIAWAHLCPVAVHALLQAEQNVALLVGMLSGGVGSQDAVTVGLAGVLLGICLLAMQTPGPPTGEAQSNCGPFLILKCY